MTRCALCDARILFGPVRDGNIQYCSATCRDAGPSMLLAKSIPKDVIEKYAATIHQGNCPFCGDHGPVDVHTAFTVWSALVVTHWQSEPRVACRRCGRKGQIQAVLLSGLIGWWGFPWGLVMTPVQIVRNLIAMGHPPAPLIPSETLKKVAAIHLANHLLAQNRNSPNQSPLRPSPPA